MSRRRKVRALEVVVVNGNLRFVRQPLLLGHYRSMALTGTERVMNALIGGTMEECLKLDSYPSHPGDNRIFWNLGPAGTNPFQKPRPEAVIVVGLGEEGQLRGTDLARTVRHGAIAWVQRTLEATQRERASLELAATLIGSGGPGISAGQSAMLIVEGIADANERLRWLKWPTVSRLLLIELYHDRAAEAWRALRMDAAARGLATVRDHIQETAGALERPLENGYRGAGYDLISTQTVQYEGESAIAYVLDTSRARTEIRAQVTQRAIVEKLVTSGSHQHARDGRIGRTLFRLLIPLELEPFLAGSTAAVLQVDRGTAGIPWELLDTTPAHPAAGAARPMPWAIRAKLLRKLRLGNFRARVQDASLESPVLIIGEPAVDPGSGYPRLRSARAEAEAVAARFSSADGAAYDVRALFSDDPELPGVRATTIINTLLERDWRIVHVTGHGGTPRPDGDSSDARSVSPGVVLSDGAFLGAREIRAMRVTPELVFINSCYSATTSANPGSDAGDAFAVTHDRARFAASVAESLIEIGVRCVIATGWAIEDEPARVFATMFYDRVLAGTRFIDAVAAARAAAFECDDSNTWAAYQCYGDPDWTWRPALDGNGGPGPEQLYAHVNSPATLALSLRTLAVNSGFDDRARKILPKHLRYLEREFADEWGRRGAVAEAFGRAWAVCDRARALDWYERALAAPDGGASFHAAYQSANLRARLAWESVAAMVDDGATDGRLAEKIAAARTEVSTALDLLQRLAHRVQSSAERENLCGSAWKRLAQIEAVAGDPQAEAAALARMREHYASAEAIAHGAGEAGVFYPLLNRLAGELVTAQEGWQGFAADVVERTRASLELLNDTDPDFWSVAGAIELQIYIALARRDLAGALPEIEKQYADLRRRMADQRMWATVYDQLRFVLRKHAGRSHAEEQAACARLLDTLGRFAAGSARRRSRQVR